jgi:hypothetical protein
MVVMKLALNRSTITERMCEKPVGALSISASASRRSEFGSPVTAVTGVESENISSLDSPTIFFDSTSAIFAVMAGNFGLVLNKD